MVRYLTRRAGRQWSSPKDQSAFSTSGTFLSKLFSELERAYTMAVKILVFLLYLGLIAAGHVLPGKGSTSKMNERMLSKRGS